MKELSIKKELLQRRWKVIYTRPRWEKKVDALLQTGEIDSYCPVKKEYHVWADRKKMVEVPLFNSYVFVNCNLKEEIQIRQTLGVINFVYFQGRPAMIREEEIERIRYFTEHCQDIEVLNVSQLAPGDKVLIKSGALTNYKGEVLQVQGKNVMMLLEYLGCVIVTKVAINNTILTT
ncbi:UpxY family transcription antiterminator [Pedobacter sp. ASV28]|jgi:transcriptional antiterminator RfaH|uniref:UpxY family transcription antiterminator n=1 Tax=Pedobacter sp. ASV28 TaxID=2795123 RepID=UPI0018ECA213|nr:UpxY family transcription antiterminator [Pedobacter sp. ASV28]